MSTLGKDPRTENSLNREDVTTDNINENGPLHVDNKSRNIPNKTNEPRMISESLSNLLVYTSSSSEDDSSSESSSSEESSSEDEEKIITKTTFRQNREDFLSDSSSGDTLFEDSDDEVGAKGPCKDKAPEIPRSKGELTLDDLPPIPDLSKLNLGIKEADCIQMGTVASVIDKLVMVESLPSIPAYDIDTLLFLDAGKRPLGFVYDVIGQVTAPMYAVRFNTKEEIDTQNIITGLPVYSAPKSKHTQYVFLKQLMKIRGSDASWHEDNEVPPEFIDYSDDEVECELPTDGGVGDSELFNHKRKRNSVEKHKIFEIEMNLRNRADTARSRLRTESRRQRPSRQRNFGLRRGFANFMRAPNFAQPQVMPMYPAGGPPPPVFGHLYHNWLPQMNLMHSAYQFPYPQGRIMAPPPPPPPEEPELAQSLTNFGLVSCPTSEVRQNPDSVSK